jgi:PhnB protein
MMGLDTAEEAERVFAELSDGGKVTMPMGESFWAARFGMVVARFGTPWMINGGLRA